MEMNNNNKKQEEQRKNQSYKGTTSTRQLNTIWRGTESRSSGIEQCAEEIEPNHEAPQNNQQPIIIMGEHWIFVNVTEAAARDGVILPPEKRKAFSTILTIQE